MSSPISFPELYKAGFDDFIIPSHEIAPFTTIQNRAKVTRSLKAIAGVERVMIRGGSLLQNEFGPAGERVFETNDKDSRVRFVGAWFSLNNDQGTRFQTTTANDFLEVTAYCTGLNLLIYMGSGAGDIRVSVDGGAEGSNIYVVSSTVLDARNYGKNTVVSALSGLTLGLHTFKIRNVSGSNGISLFGFEILNQRTDLAVYPGSGIAQGALNGLSSLATSSFTDGVTGTRGARVVKYVDNGTLKSAVQAVDTSAAYLAAASHTNEEVVRRINFREFGANRADDFSTLGVTIGSRAFTLDDGTTTLVCTSTGAQGNMLAINNVVGAFVTITFVGTGLDFSVENTWTTPLTFVDVLVDGVSVGALTAYSVLGTATAFARVRVVSGLPYGTHTVRFTTNASVNAGITDFIIYQPKKPSIPAGALEVADYNVMASFSTSGRFVSNSNDGFVGESALGVLRKHNIRELTYTGTWAIGLGITANSSGFEVGTTTANSTVSYSFYGTGIMFGIGASGNGTRTFNLKINGANFTTATTVYNTISNGGAGNYTVANSARERFVVSGLALGFHTILITFTTGPGNFYPEGFDIITPIHINQPNLKTGSLSLKSATKYSPEKVVSNAGPDLSKAKAWVYYDQVNSRILSSYNVSAVLNVSAFTSNIYFEKPFKNANYVATGLPNQAQLDEDTRLPNVFQVTSSNSAGSGAAGLINVCFFGELIDEV